MQSGEVRAIAAYYEHALALNEQELSIQIICPYRIKYYEPFLQYFYQTLFDQFGSEPAINQALNAQLGWPLLQRLDNELINVLNNDLEEYYLEHDAERWPDAPIINIRQLTAQASQIEFERYLQLLVQRPENIDGYINQHYPELANILQMLTDDFLTNIQRALQRFNQDKLTIERAFFSEDAGSSSSAPVIALTSLVLQSIACDNAEWHEEGRQVLIFTIVKNGHEVVKVVYKPSSLLMDAMIVGQLKKLVNLDPVRFARFSGKTSFLELLNDLAKFSEEKALTTYLVVPMVNTPVREAYGYLQYIPSEPENRVDYYTLGKQAVINASVNANLNGIIPQVFNQQHKEFLKESLQDGSCDFIATNIAELERFSFQAGYYAGIARILGLNDFHVGNAIVSNKKLVMIDLQCAGQLVSCLADTLICDSTVSPFISNTRVPQPIAYFLDINHTLYTTKVLIPGKNRMYSAPAIASGDFEGYAPDATQFVNGFEHFLRIMQEHPAAFEQWLNSLKQQNPVVRVLPYSTYDFITTLTSYRSREYAVDVIEGFAMDCVEKYPDNPTAPTCAIFAAPSVINSLKRMVVPSFFIKLNGKDIVDGQGKPIPITKEILQNLYKKYPDLECPEIDNSLQHYQEITSAEWLDNIFQEVIYSQPFRDALIRDAKAAATLINPVPVMSSEKSVVRSVEHTNEFNDNDDTCHIFRCTCS